MPGIKQKSDAEKAGVSCNAFGIAVLTSQIAKNGEQEDGWRMLLPAGYFKAKDGRPFEMDIAEKGWFIDHAIATNLINDVAALKQDLPVDYEHQTINSAKNGLPAPASGWFNQAELKWQNDGLYIRPRWTKTAAAFLKNDEYRFLSAVFVYDAKTGYPQKLLSVALTNDPALTGMEELTQIAALKNMNLNTQQETRKVDELLKKLLAALGITAEGEDYASAIDAAMQKIDTLSNVSKDVAALKAQIESKESKVDLAQYVPIATYNALRENVASLKAENDQQSIDQLIDAGKKSGRVVASEVDYLKMLGAQNGVASLKAAIDGRSAIAALAATQTTDTPKDTGIAVLTADQKEACRVLGKTETEYLTFLGAK